MRRSILMLIVWQMVSACDSFLEVTPPNTKIPIDRVFQDDPMAEAALTGIYMDLYSYSGFAGGGNPSVMVLAGLSADELRNIKNEQTSLQFENNSINPSLATLETFWGSLYKSIYETNAAIEGLEASQTLTDSVKTRLKGEALFVRAFCYFYLVNIFGEAPLAVSTDYKTNNELKRSPVQDIYDQMIEDLTSAETLLSEQYISADRTHPNKYAASALLARVYLYRGDWARAEDKATNVLTQTDTYSLQSELNNVFLSTSKEAIWQLRPFDGVGYTNEAYCFLISNSVGNVLREEVISAFEPNDSRQVKWTSSVTTAGVTTYFPFKYKEYTNSALPDEYPVVIRLAELYLIRAEARLMQHKTALAVADVDAIRNRAGL